jgi:hypothetical protein
MISFFHESSFLHVHVFIIEEGVFLMLGID